MRLLRPYVPTAIRLIVAARQADALGFRVDESQSQSRQLRALLRFLFGRATAHLDHCPALQNRPFNKRTGKYTPEANDPEHLIYRRADEHRIKTLVRGDGAQHSDAGLNRKLKRIARNRNPKRRKAKIPARVNPWPKGRKFGG